MILLHVRHWLKRHLSPPWRYFMTRKQAPLSASFGYDRGQPIDRYYIEKFLHEHRSAIRGRCLEVADDGYTKKFDNGVIQSDVLDLDTRNANATIHGDLRHLDSIADNIYDCVILTQVLQFIDDLPAAVREVHRILKPGGVLLATLPCVSPIDTESGCARDHWRFTEASTEYLFWPVFGKEHTIIETHGNCYAGLAFWIGMSREELTQEQLAYHDPKFPCLIIVKAVK